MEQQKEKSRVAKTISVLPSLLTLCNFSCGFISMVLCVQSIFWLQKGQLTQNLDLISKSGDYLEYACLIIFLGMVFDMMDGRVARMTNSQCQFGGELDSLADVCSFGLAPAVILATLWTRIMPDNAQWWSLAVMAGVIYAACAALRLAMYNLTICEKPKDYFSGLPSPAAAGAVVAAVIFLRQPFIIDAWKYFYDTLLASTSLGGKDWKVLAIYLFSFYVIAVGLLMVSRFRFAHLTNLWFGKGKKFTFLICAVIAVTLLIYCSSVMLFLGFNAFIVICLFINIRNRIHNREHEIDKDMSEVLSFDDQEESGESGEKPAECPPEER